MDKKYCIQLKDMKIWHESLCHFCTQGNCEDRQLDSYILDPKTTRFKRITKRQTNMYGVKDDK